MENIKLYSSQIISAETTEDSDTLIAKFLICDFGVNGNNVKLNRGTIENWVSTLQHKPLVGKIGIELDGSTDFEGHNGKVVIRYDENGVPYKTLEFDTDAFGTFTDVAIEEIDGIECITATCEIWKRFTNAYALILRRIESGTLNTSWEISVLKSHSTVEGGKITKVIDDGRFTAQCLLGATVVPAYQTSKLLEVASLGEDNDTELAEALSQDMQMLSDIETQNSIKEDETTLAKQKETVASEEVLQTQTVAENKESQETSTEAEVNKTATEETPATNVTSTSEVKTETSALTEWDLRDKIREACRSKIDKWCWVAYHFPIEKQIWVEVEDRESELDYLLFTYSVENDVVTVSEPTEVKLTVSVKEVNSAISTLNSEIESKNNALAEASKTIQTLNVTIAELTPFKDQVEKAEQERIEAETLAKKETLKETAMATGLITKEEIETSEEISGLIDALNEKELNQIIATRLIASLQAKPKETKVETASVKEQVATASLVNDETDLDTKTIMKSFLGGRK